MLQPDTQNGRLLLDRILEVPGLAQVVPQLPSEVLHRVIQQCGLEDCGALVALITPDQLQGVLDLDLWRAAEPGFDEQLDADRFGLWLEVLADLDATTAAQLLAKVDIDLVSTALAQHVRVFDGAALPPTGDDHTADDAVGASDARPTCEIGGYHVQARRSGSWNAIVAALIALDADHQDLFHRIMRGCRRLSNSAPEIDGLDDLLTDREQAMFDVTFDREQRRERQGFVTPAQARAFLQMSRERRLDPTAVPPGENPVARAYFRSEHGTPPMATPDNTTSSDAPKALGPAAPSAEGAAVVATVVDVLREAGVIPPLPRALLTGSGGDTRLRQIQAQMRFVHDCNAAAALTRGQELGFLANTLMAGCSIQGRPFTPQEASEAATAVCNLGLEIWPLTPLPDDFLVDHDLVDVFHAGWAFLHQHVCLFTAERVINVLTQVRCQDRELQMGLDVLRRQLRWHANDGAPWRARDAMDVIALLDIPAWAALLALIDECPVLHAVIVTTGEARKRTISATAFEFISETSQLAPVRAFLEALPATLSG